MIGTAGGVVARLAAAAYGAGIIGGLVIGALGPAHWQDAIANAGPGCPVLGLTGVACPFCGMTRATLALGAGDWDRALALHPLAPVVVLGALALLATVALGRADVLLRGRRPWYLIGAIGALWIARLVL